MGLELFGWVWEGGGGTLGSAIIKEAEGITVLQKSHVQGAGCPTEGEVNRPTPCSPGGREGKPVLRLHAQGLPGFCSLTLATMNNPLIFLDD